MSGTESAMSYNDWKIDPNDLNEFVQSGYKGADILGRGLKSRVNGNNGQQVGDIFYDKNLNPLSLQDSRAAAQTYSAFNDWKDKRAKTNAEYVQYSNASKAKPGRSATILTPMSGPEGKTVLGSFAPKKTVLG